MDIGARGVGSNHEGMAELSFDDALSPSAFPAITR
jgi:hypothetical protein